MKIARACLLVLFLAGCATIVPESPEPPPPPSFFPSAACKGCHDRIFEQHVESHHEKSFSNPVFQGQYFDELIPRAEKDKDLLAEAKTCAACHMPVSSVHHKGQVIAKGQVIPELSSVTCDLCHTVAGYEGAAPGNGNYVLDPGLQKLGPFTHEQKWHHYFSELQTKSEFCAICHNATNHYGLEVKSTYTEWKGSTYAEKKIQCQDCHMTTLGFLVAGKPFFESGKAAYMTLGSAPERSKLYTHRFPGAHSKSQITGALTVAVEVKQTTAVPGDEITIRVLVDNKRTGHKMPSGSADLRLLWLALEAQIGDKVFPIPASSRVQGDAYDVAGEGRFDREVLAGDIPEGSRLYRAVFVNAEGKQTLSFYEAVRIAFDNRLDAAEIREETYHFKIPKNADRKTVLRARLNYLPYPASFSNRYSQPKPEAVVLSVAEKEVILK